MTHPSRLRRYAINTLIAGFYAAALFSVLFALAFWWAAAEFARPGPLQATAYITVERGDDLKTIAYRLKDANAVENPYIFVFGTLIMRAQSDLKAGEYEIAPAASPRAIMFKMKNGETFKRRVTLREGLTSHEIIALLNARPYMTGTIAAPPPDGTLLPGTYDYKNNEGRNEILARMKADMDKTLSKAWESRTPNLPLETPAQALVLASIIEKETGVADERRRVAGVFINRLRLNMPLQTDPTVIYAITNGKPETGGQGPLGRRLLSKDLEIESPYNTYKYPGLPPGPICNPGKESIEAALNPETHDYLFFVADGTGGHAFARTLAEHNANVAKWRAIRDGN